MLQASIIQRLRNGEEPAFTELVLSTSSRLMTVAKVYTDSVQDAEDILQDAYVIVYQKIGMFVGDEPKAFYGWMKRILINLALSKNKKKYKKLEQSLDTMVVDQPFNANVLSNLSRDEIMQLVFSLPSGYRQVFALFAIEGYSHKEIAEQLGVKVSTSRSQFLRAKRVMQEKVNRLYKNAV